MRREYQDEGGHRGGPVPARARPNEARAAAAARLAGGARAARAAADGVAARPPRSEARPARTARRRPAPAAAQPTGTRTRTRAMADPSAVVGSHGAAALAAQPVPAPREEQRPRHLRVVEPGTLSAGQRRRRARAVLIASIGAASVIAFALVYFHVVLAQRQFHIDRLNADVSKAQTSYQNLRLHVAELGSPDQIISTAEGRLGMVQPTKVVYLAPNTPAPAGSVPAPSGIGTSASAAGPAAGGTVQSPSRAPAGDADWPSIKSQLAGTP